MIPNTGMTLEEFTDIIDTFYTEQKGNVDFKIEGNRVGGEIEGVDNLSQAIDCILKTERFKYNTVSTDIGLELEEMYGRSDDFMEVDLLNTIQDAIMVDDRVDRIEELELKKLNVRGAYLVNALVLSNLGDLIQIEREVKLDAR